MWSTTLKVLFSADWHIKLNVKNIPNEWAINRFRTMFSNIETLSSKVDLHIVGGDIFDKLPNLEDLQLFFEFVQGCKVPTLIFDGNHEATKKGKTFLSHLKSVVNSLNSKVTILDEFHSIENMDFIPYCRLKEYFAKHIGDGYSGDILFTHVRGEIPPHVKSEIPLELLEPWKLVFAGDLHSHSNCQRNIIYPGSPITTSFHRSLVETGVVILDSETLQWEWKKLEVPQLIRKTINAGDPMPASEYHHTIYEVEGDMSELGSMLDSELLDKKIVKRNTETALILDPEMTMDQELDEYLRFILELDDETIKRLMKEYHNVDRK